MYKNLHDLLLTDQDIRSETDNQRWRYFHILHVVYRQKHITRQHMRSKFNETELRKTPCLSLTTRPYLNLPKVCNVASLALVRFQIQFPYRYMNSRIMAVTMDPKPEKLRENVILKLKNLKVIWKLAFMRCFDLFSPIKFIFRSWQQRSTVCFGVAKGEKTTIYYCKVYIPSQIN